MLLALIMNIFITSTYADLSIVYTNDLEGSVTTCGCATDPGGGVERRLNWLKAQKLAPKDTIYVNAGNTLFTDLPSLAHEDKVEMLGAQILLDSFKQMKLDASNIGRSDLKKGLNTFNSASKGMPIVISNSDDPKYNKSINIKRAGKDVVIIGLVQPELLDGSSALGLKLYDMEKALSKELSKINKKKASFTIALIYSDEDGLKKLVKKAKGIDLILSAGLQEELPVPMNMNGVNVIRLLNGGDSIGLLSIKEQSPGKYAYINKISFLGPEYEGKTAISNKIKKYTKMK